VVDCNDIKLLQINMIRKLNHTHTPDLIFCHTFC